MKLHPEARAYMRAMASKGGKAKGKSKSRGDSEYYRQLVRKRYEKKP